MDDSLILNNPTFEEAIRDIYPLQVELKGTTETESRLSYLDIKLTRKFTTAVFDKRDRLDFHIATSPI